MALTTADLDRLDTAIASSELEVEVDGRRIRYRSMSELQSARAHVAGVLSSTVAGGAQQRRTGYPVFITARER